MSTNPILNTEPNTTSKSNINIPTQVDSVLEVELKFSLQDDAIESVIQWLETLTDPDLNDSDFNIRYSDTSYDHIAQNHIHQKHVRYLVNTYFETPTNLLRQHDMGLRVRDVDGQFEMTLKTVAIGPAGIQQRHEYNVALSDDQLDLTKLPKSALPDEWNLVELGRQLFPLFTTDFTRQTWLVDVVKDMVKDMVKEFASGTVNEVTHPKQISAQIEIVLDRGKILSAGRQETIQELEIELKSGSVSVMMEFAHHCLAIEGLRLSDLSKAARGYMLLNLQPPKAPKSKTLETISDALAWIFYYEECIFRDCEPAVLVKIEDKTEPDLYVAINQICETVLMPQCLFEGYVPVQQKSDLFSPSYNQLKLSAISFSL